MSNSTFIYITLEAVKFFGKPFFNGDVWENITLEEGKHRVFISETRAYMLGVPVEQDEEPCAYVYSVYGKGGECYMPVYDRTNRVETERLYPKEIVTSR